MPRNSRTKQFPNAVSIKTASAITGIEVHTLRYWETEFPDFLRPLRTRGGQRRYRPEDVQVVFALKRLLRDEMYSIAGARRYLQLQQKETSQKAA